MGSEHQPHTESERKRSTVGTLAGPWRSGGAVTYCRGSSRGMEPASLGSPASAGKRSTTRHVLEGTVPTHSSFLKSISLSVLSWRWAQLLCLRSLGSSFYLDLSVVWMIQFWPIPNEFSKPWTRFVLHVVFTHLHTFGCASLRSGICYF